MKTIIIFIALVFSSSVFAGPPRLYSSDGKYLGNLSTNQADPNSISNEAGQYGSEASPDSIYNKAGKYGSQASPYSPNNPAASGTNTPRIYGSDGKYLGNLNSNPSDPNSVSNPAGRYGSPASPDSINNPSGKYGSPASPYSANNPAAIGR